MFKLTLQDIALGWFETESPTWLTEDQMKQAFLKRFNPWGDTRHQQPDAWNKLKFDMTKDYVDAFVVDIKCWPVYWVIMTMSLPKSSRIYFLTQISKQH